MYRMSGIQGSWNTTQSYMNQYSRLGNRQPPNMVNVPSALLQAASPKALNLVEATKVDMTAFHEVTSNCRNYQGYAGLRRLQASNVNRTALEPGCGWILTEGGGGRGAYGLEDGVPTMSDIGEPDLITGGNTFIKDLVGAERQMIEKIGLGINNSSTLMKNLNAEVKPFVGYCKSSRNIIPIVTSDNGQTITPRFPTDLTYGCAASNIVPSSDNAGFQNYRKISDRTFDNEGFTDTTFLTSCAGIGPTSPQWPDCIKQATKAAGCRTNGTLYQDPTGQTVAYNRAFSLLASENINSSMTTIDTAFNTFSKIANTAPTRSGPSAAIQELCFQQGYLNENYNWCQDIPDTTTISATNSDCIMNIWRTAGAATMGISAPYFQKWSGKTFGSFRQYVRSLMTSTTQTNKDKQVLGISQTIGTPTYGETYSGNPVPPQPVDCGGSWSAWTNCSATACGTTGTTARTYTVSRAAANNGVACPSPLTQTSTCTAAPCTPVDCVGSWTGGNSTPIFPACNPSYQSATASDHETKRVTYTIQTSAANGGRACPYTNGETRTEECATTYVPPQPVDCTGSWGAWDIRDCQGWEAFTGYGRPGALRTRTYTVKPATNGGRTDTCGEYNQTTISTERCPTVQCPTYTIGQPKITNNDDITMENITFKWLGDYKLQYTRRGDGQASFQSHVNGHILCSSRDTMNLAEGNRNEYLSKVIIGKNDYTGIDVANKIKNLTTPYIEPNTGLNAPSPNTRDKTWVNFLIISPDKESYAILRNSGINNINDEYAFMVYGEFVGNKYSDKSGLVDQTGTYVGTPRFCETYKLYYALTKP